MLNQTDYSRELIALAFITGVRAEPFLGADYSGAIVRRNGDGEVEVTLDGTTYVVAFRDTWLEYVIKE